MERHAISHSAPVAKETLAPVAVPRYGKNKSFFMFEQGFFQFVASQKSEPILWISIIKIEDKKGLDYMNQYAIINAIRA